MDSLFEKLRILLITFFAVDNGFGIRVLISEFHTNIIAALENHDGFQGTCFQSTHSVFHTIDGHVGIQGNILKEFAENLFFMLEFLTLHAFGAEFNGLVETIFATITSVNHFHDLGE